MTPPNQTEKTSAEAPARGLEDFETTNQANIIRSSFCADGVLGGTKLFLICEGQKFLVASRFQNIGRRKPIEDAIALFERALVGER